MNSIRTRLTRRHGHLTPETLMRLLDGELPAWRVQRAEAHLAACAQCRERRAVIEGVDVKLARGHRGSAEDLNDLRTALSSRLATQVEPPQRARTQFPAVRHWLAAAAACLAAVVLVWAAQGRNVTAPAPSVLPDATLTPGAVDVVTAARLCAPGRIRARVPDPVVRARVLESYRMADVPSAEYELDYLITPELGGAPDQRNLWPQRYGSAVWNARVKDDLEQLLPQLVCGGTVNLAEAQRDIAENWVAAYRKYFHTDRPLPRRIAEIDDDDDLEEMRPLRAPRVVRTARVLLERARWHDPLQ